MTQPTDTDPLLLLSIDGQTVEALPEETILACARRHGLYIPSLCELNDIDHAPGTCRVCLVEVESPAPAEQPLLAAACVTPAQAGMTVQTRSRRAREAQRLQVELLLADHNQDCATCVRHGNCELQDVAQFVGLHTNRFFDRERALARAVDRSSSAMIRDMTKCVRCQRCIAICRHGQTVDALEVTGFGQDTAVGLRHGLSQAESTCVTCGQCVLVCPTGALGERDETDRVLDYLFDPEIVTVFQFAPAVRVGFGEEFGFPAGTNVEGQIIAALRSLGADIVLDTNFAADVVIMEESAELLRRLQGGQRPTFTSCCPAWINFAERHYPDLLPLLSSTKSPQQCLGAIAKTYLPERMGIDPVRIRVISIMPCIAKKDERTRPQLGEGDRREVDLVLTTREFARLLKRRGLDLRSLAPSTFDNPYMSAYSGAGAIFGTTGGVMEAAVRTMYQIVNGRELDHAEVVPLRGFEGLRTAAVEVGGAVGTVKVAMAHGLGPARVLCERIRAGEADFDFIEIMACPGGCIGGGGQPIPVNYEIKTLRAQALYSEDKSLKYRKSHENPSIKKIYDEFLIEPLGEKSHHLLHTKYTPRSNL